MCVNSVGLNWDWIDQEIVGVVIVDSNTENIENNNKLNDQLNECEELITNLTKTVNEGLVDQIKHSQVNHEG